MAEIRNLGDAFSWPIARLAECFGIHRQTLTKRIKDAGLAPSGTWRGNPTYHIAEVAELLHAGEDRGGQNPDEMTPQDRKAWYDSEKTRRQLQALERDLIPVGEVERVVATSFAAIAQELRALPDNLERRHGIAPEVVIKVEEGIFVAMDTLADKLAELQVPLPDEDDDAA
jgi:hypothetical protein